MEMMNDKDLNQIDSSVSSNQTSSGWDDDNDYYSCDSDSICGITTEFDNERNNNWREWRKMSDFQTIIPGTSNPSTTNTKKTNNTIVMSLTEITSRFIAKNLPFELVERVSPPVPEELQLRIAFWSFPEIEDEIFLYSCLANTSSVEYLNAESAIYLNCVKNIIQIGFYLTGTVSDDEELSPKSKLFDVAITFDRGRISSCKCSCRSKAAWCSHIIAVCLYRIFNAKNVPLRAPISESLSCLDRNQLQKFAQYLISEMPQEILPTAQRIIDNLLNRTKSSLINIISGAPDPTAGPSINDETFWYLDSSSLHLNIRRTLRKFCEPSPTIYSDVDCLTTSAPTVVAQWSFLLRPLRGRVPEGIWNLINILREMFLKKDRNAIRLLEIITKEILKCDQIVFWWFHTKLTIYNEYNCNFNINKTQRHRDIAQYASGLLCDEIVILWRLAVLDPALSKFAKNTLYNRFCEWQVFLDNKLDKSSFTVNTAVFTTNKENDNTKSRKYSIFDGFKSAMEACFINWNNFHTLNKSFNLPSLIDNTDLLKSNRNINDKINIKLEDNSLNDQLHSNDITSECTQSVSLVTRINREENVISEDDSCDNDDEPTTSHSVSNNHRKTIFSYDSSDTDSDTELKFGNCSYVSNNKRHSYRTKEVTNNENNQINSDENRVNKSLNSPEQSDEYAIYFYDSVKDNNELKLDYNTETYDLINNQMKNLKINDRSINCNNFTDFDIRYAQAEGLYTHGYRKEAVELVFPLAVEFIQNPPNLVLNLASNDTITPSPNGDETDITNTIKASTSTSTNNVKIKKKRSSSRMNSQHHYLTCLTTETLKKCHFLSMVLMDIEQYRNVGFRIGLLGLELNRLPSSTKGYEVQLAYQETELVNLLKDYILSEAEVKILIEKAIDLKKEVITRKTILLLNLAHFIFDALVTIPNSYNGSSLFLNKNDNELIAFEAVIHALGSKTNVSEAEHPLLCEGIRRQRGDLASALLLYYKDDQWKLLSIMDKLLDKDMHLLTRFQLIAGYYSTNPPTRSQSSRLKLNSNNNNNNRVNNRDNNYDNTDYNLSNNNQDNIEGTNSSNYITTINEPVNVSRNNTMTGPLAWLHKVPRFNKELRFKKIYPKLPNQPSAATAHFIFELAKNILFKAGGDSTITLFTPNTDSGITNRGLLMCSLQLALYALGVHNCVSPNWFSRTYSTYVAWITGHAIELGPAALAFIVDCWEGHFTPSEALSLADKASRTCNSLMIQSASELAISCLKHSFALSRQEILSALLLCKDHNGDALEEGCLIIENVAKSANIDADVLFKVSQHWFDLYLSKESKNMSYLVLELTEYLKNRFHSYLNQNSLKATRSPFTDNDNQFNYDNTSQSLQFSNTTTNKGKTFDQLTFPVVNNTSYTLGPYDVSNIIQYPYSIQNQQSSIYLPTLTPYYQSSNHNHNQQHSSIPAILTSTPQYTRICSIFDNVIMPTVNGSIATNVLIPNQYSSFGQPYFIPLTKNHNFNDHNQHNLCHPKQQMHNLSYNNNQSYHFHQQPQLVPVQQPKPFYQDMNQFTLSQQKYLLSVYRTGLLAVEALAKKIHEDKILSKFSRNPTYGLPVMWHLRISKYLGHQYLQRFCIAVANCISNPFLLYDIVIEAAYYYSGMNCVAFSQHMETTLLTLVQKCQQMFLQCMNHKIYHLGDFEEFFAIFDIAKNAFYFTPNDMSQLKDWIETLKRSKNLKSNFWSGFNVILQANGLQ